MPTLRRELAFKPGDMAANSGEWWHLVLDTDHPGLWVEHSWERLNPVSGQSERGFDRFGINDFLRFLDNEEAHAALMGALRDLVTAPAAA